jgi:hypothetical protein
MLAVAAIGGFIGLSVLILVVLRLVRGDEFDYDEDDEDDDEDWEEEEDFMSSLNTTRPTPQRSPTRSTPTRTGPTGSAPKSSGGPKKGPPGRAPSVGPPQSKAPSGPSRGRSVPTKVTQVDSTDTSEEPEDGSAKVRKARLKIDLSIFEDWQADDREAAADWVRTALDDGDAERTIMMQLQETGWTAPQSRAIFDLGRSR